MLLQYNYVLFLQVLNIREHLEDTETPSQEMGDDEKALVREMCNVSLYL